MPWKRSLNSLAMLMLMSSSIANAQSADSFKTAEYNEMGYNVLDAVNAASAYANGYTGKGVIVGVCDDPINFLVPEFDLKQNSEMINVAGAGVYNWANFTHGTHVAGVVAASKNGLGMHGIAFDAEIKVGFITVTVRLRAARTFMLIMCSIRKSRLSIIPGELGAI